MSTWVCNDFDEEFNQTFTGKDYILNFTSSGYTTTTTSRFMVCKRQEDDKAVPIAGATATNINNKALEAPIFFEIFRWSKDSKE